MPTQTLTSKLQPTKWDNQPKMVLYGTYLITTVFDFSAEVTITSALDEVIGTFSIPKKSGFDGGYIGELTIPQDTKFPLIINSKITCSTDFDYSIADQVALGTKVIKDKRYPVSYQATQFCNDNLKDPNRDMDYNDFVLTWQLYNSSTD